MGAISPFSPQASLLRAVVEQRGDGYAAATVHRFQGGERNLIVWDMTEGRAGGTSVNKWFDATSSDQEGSRLINVALSRAQDQLVVLADLDRVRAACLESSTLRRTLRVIAREGEVVDAAGLLARSDGRTQLRRGASPTHPLEVARRAASGWLAVWASNPPSRISDEVALLLRRAVGDGLHVAVRTGVPKRQAQWEALTLLQQIGCSVQLVRPCWENLVLADSMALTSGGSLLDVGPTQAWVETRHADFAGAVGRLVRRSGERDYSSAQPDRTCPKGHPLLLDHGHTKDFRGRCLLCDGDVSASGEVRSGRRRVKTSAQTLTGCRSCGQGFDLAGRCGC